MSKKPLIKDAVEYFKDHNNWMLIWHDPKTDLFMSKLKGCPVVKLGMYDHRYNEYVRYKIDDLLFFYPATGYGDIHKVPCRPSLNCEEIRDLIRHHWEDNE